MHRAAHWFDVRMNDCASAVLVVGYVAHFWDLAPLESKSFRQKENGAKVTYSYVRIARKHAGNSVSNGDTRIGRVY